MDKSFLEECTERIRNIIRDHLVRVYMHMATLYWVGSSLKKAMSALSS